MGWVVDDVHIYECEAATVPEPPMCSGIDALVQNQVFDGILTCDATSSLEANSVVFVKFGAEVQFQSPEMTLALGLSVEVGAVFSVKTSQ